MLWLPQVADRIYLVVLAIQSWSNGSPQIDIPLYFIACNFMLWYPWTRFKATYTLECIICCILSFMGAMFLSGGGNLALASVFLGAGRSTYQTQMMVCITSQSPNKSLRFMKSILQPCSALIGLAVAVDARWTVILQGLSALYVISTVWCLYTKDEQRVSMAYRELSTTRVSLGTQIEINALRSGQWLLLVNAIYLSFVVLTWSPVLNPANSMVVAYAVAGSYLVRCDYIWMPVSFAGCVFMYEMTGIVPLVSLGFLLLPSLMIQNHITPKLPTDNCKLFSALHFDSFCVYMTECIAIALYPVPHLHLVVTALCLCCSLCLCNAAHQYRFPGTFWDSGESLV